MKATLSFLIKSNKFTTVKASPIHQLLSFSLLSQSLPQSSSSFIHTRRYASHEYALKATSSNHYDTIFALSSGQGVSGVSVIRLSGQHARVCLKALCSPKASFPDARKAALRKLYCPMTGDLLDQALVLWFPTPNSFTGEDVVELHVHGSRAVILGVFKALEFLDGKSHKAIAIDSKLSLIGTAQAEIDVNFSIRPADRGEFTRRAFDNGKMDLTEVEGLADLLAADTSEQRKQALRQMDGYLKVSYEKWRHELIGCLAHTEAVIDFGDDDREDDVNDDAMWALTPRIRKLKEELEYHLDDGKRGEIVRDGIKIALAGPPNAGKSSLMNALARRPAAIVSPIAGTTRDIVEVRMDLAGVSCIVSDTAGIRLTSNDPIEIEGMKRARQAFNDAQIKIFVSDASNKDSVDTATSMLTSLLEEADAAINADDSSSNASQDRYRVLMIRNKADLLAGDSGSSSGSVTMQGCSQPISTVAVSCTTGYGITELEEMIVACIKSFFEKSNDEGVLITRERHRRHLKQCIYHLDQFLSTSLLMDAAAEELRLAMQELGKVTGRVDVEELLDVIFRDFCIGK